MTAEPDPAALKYCIIEMVSYCGRKQFDSSKGFPQEIPYMLTE